MSSLSPSPPPLRLTTDGAPTPRVRSGGPGAADRRRSTGPIKPSSPRLRLVSDGPAVAAKRSPPRDADPAEPIREALDPRWVFAVRVAEQLQGAVLSADRRERLIRLGKVLGLTAFDASLIIAIVQDQARRGHAPESCPAAGEAQLRMIPRPDPARPSSRPLAVAALLVGLLAAELMLLSWLF